jgi:hypothetical protein
MRIHVLEALINFAMKAALLAFAICLPGLLPAGEVSVSISPEEHHFEVLLTTDNDQPDYVIDTVPDVIIRHRASKITLAKLAFTSDVNSDHRPLRDHMTVDWGSDCVAITTTERFYSSLSVFRFVGTYAEPKSFVEVQFPDIGKIIQTTVPKFKEFRSRWHEHFRGWPGRNLVMFSSGSTAMTEPRSDGDTTFPASFSFTFDITDPLAPVLRRMEASE